MKVLIWNVEKFTISRLTNTTIRKEGQFTSRKVTVEPARVESYFQEVFTGGGDADYTPEVIAILELLTPKDPLGTLLGEGTAGAQGMFRLLKLIKQWTHNPAWRLVPPLKLNPKKPVGLDAKWAQNEAIGILYDSSRVAFRGPNVWNNNQSLGPAVAGQPYGAAGSVWRKVAITGGTTNAGIVQYYDQAGTAIRFDDYHHRRPFLVDMQETYGTQRLIRLVFMHTSPGFHEGGTREMAKMTQLQPGTAGPPIVLCGGDFNVNDYDVASSVYSYRPLYDLRFRKRLTKEIDYSTHYRPVSEAEPGGWTKYQKHQLIDNILIRHQTKTAAKNQKYTSAAIDVVTPFPHPPYDTVMDIKLADYPTYQGQNPGPVGRFRQWPNFWHIRTTSDHTPIYVDIQ
ncbi:MAG: hypothetical protein ABI779_18470 [Acidobacteriota bacterium]